MSLSYGDRSWIKMEQNKYYFDAYRSQVLAAASSPYFSDLNLFNSLFVQNRRP